MWFLISASYARKLNAVCLTFYNSETGEIRNWYDSDFRAYCLAQANEDPTLFCKNIVNIEQVERYDALRDQKLWLRKVNFKTPIDVKQTHDMSGYWENHIRYHLSYIYDKDLKMACPTNL